MKRIREYGIVVGNGRTGRLNKITDVPGIRVGHYTLEDGEHNTGLTIIMPGDDIYQKKMLASSYIINGYGKAQGLIQVNEMGYIETPIILTNTLNIGKVHDGLVSYMLKHAQKDGISITSINPVIGECNDYPLNNIQDRCLDESSVQAAIDNACTDFEEGSVGAGKGTICLGVKGGIGSSSRLTMIDGNFYTVGVLVQTNFGGINDLIIDGKKVGDELKEKLEYIEPSKGSIMIVVATDLPVTERQLKRILKRCEVGLARVGSTIGNSSGDVVIGFTTANRLYKTENENFRNFKVVCEEKLDYVFRQVADATEEAILNALATAKTTSGYNGNTRYSLTDLYLTNYFNNKNYEAYIENFPILNQYPDYPTGCESVALFTLLKYYRVDVTMEDIVDALKKGDAPYLENGVMYGGNPEIEFIGNPKDVYSYGVYEGPIKAVADKFKPGIKNISGSSLDEVLNLVKNGHPVQVWTSIRLAKPYISNKSWICKENDTKITWKAPFHSLVIIGYSKDYVVVSDPDLGSIYDYDRKKFEEAYDFFGKRALYYDEINES